MEFFGFRIELWGTVFAIVSVATYLWYKVKISKLRKPVRQVLYERISLGHMDVAEIIQSFRETKRHPIPSKFFIEKACKVDVKRGLIHHNRYGIIRRYSLSEKGRMVVAECMDRDKWLKGEIKFPAR